MVTPVPPSREKPGRVRQAARWQHSGRLGRSPGPPWEPKPKSLAQRWLPFPEAAGLALGSAASISHPLLFAALSRQFGTFLFGISFVYPHHSKSRCGFKLLYYYSLFFSANKL